MPDVAIRQLDGEVRVELGRHAAPALPVLPALGSILPHGLRRGSSVGVSGSISLLLALLGAASAHGAWCALVGLPHISAEAATEYGIDLTRLALVPRLAPAPGRESTASWASAVGALLDAVDVVAARLPQRIVDGDARRLNARIRSRDAVFIPFTSAAPDAQGRPAWPGTETRLHAQAGPWSGIGEGCGRLRQRQVVVRAAGRGRAGRDQPVALWLPAGDGGIETVGPRPSSPARARPGGLSEKDLRHRLDELVTARAG